MEYRFVYAWVWHVIGLLLLATIIGLSITPKPPMVLTFQFGDKVGHFLAYFCLMGWYVQIIRVPWLYWLLAGLFVAMGLGLEFIQGMGHTRFFEWADALANSLGVIVAALMGFTRFRLCVQAFERWMTSKRG